MSDPCPSMEHGSVPPGASDPECRKPGSQRSKVYSPARVTETARKMGLKDGWALDLTVDDPDDGLPWNFDDESKRAKAMRLLKQDEPFMLIVSPMCGPFSALQALFNHAKMTDEDLKEIVVNALGTSVR